jgi:hypothetical protein
MVNGTDWQVNDAAGTKCGPKDAKKRTNGHCWMQRDGLEKPVSRASSSRCRRVEAPA